jgi:hypothetical protein
MLASRPMTNKKPAEQDNFGDWRISFVTTSLSDIPAAYPGGPSHKAGTPLYFASLSSDPQHNAIGFVTPSPTALALSVAIKSATRATELRKTLALTDTVTPIGRGKNVANENLTHLYDFFEHCMTSVICSFQAVEMFSNEQIARHCTTPYHLLRNEKTMVLNSEKLERIASTDEKVGDILPQLLSMKTPKGTELWERFLALKVARDSTVHCKSKEMRSYYLELDKQSLFFQFFRRKATDYPRAAFELIRYFHPNGELSRWALSAERRLREADEEFH